MPGGCRSYPRAGLPAASLWVSEEAREIDTHSFNKHSTGTGYTNSAMPQAQGSVSAAGTSGGVRQVNRQVYAGGCVR